MKNKLTTTLVVIPKGYKYIEVKSLGKIIVKPIKNISNGATFKEIFIDEMIKHQEGEKE